VYDLYLKVEFLDFTCELHFMKSKYNMQRCFQFSLQTTSLIHTVFPRNLFRTN